MAYDNVMDLAITIGVIILVLCIISSCIASISAAMKKKKNTAQETTQETTTNEIKPETHSESEAQPESQSDSQSQSESHSEEILPETNNNVRPVFDEEQQSAPQEIRNVITIEMKGDVGDERYNLLINGRKYEDQKVAVNQNVISTYVLNEPLTSLVIEYTNDKKVNGKDRNIRVSKLYLNDINLLPQFTKVGTTDPKKLDSTRKGIFAWSGSYKYQSV